MEVGRKHVVVTGAASGIGRALSQRFAAEGASVVVADRNGSGARGTAGEITAAGGTAIALECDVRDDRQVRAMVAAAEAAYGPVDLLCSNAGVAGGGGPEAPDEVWAEVWEVNFRAHVYGARAVLPGMLERGRGYLLHTASAAGLLTVLGDAPYAVSKHAVIALAEWLAITYGDRGIGVSVLCPQGVNTPMSAGAPDSTAGRQVLEAADLLEPEEVAESVVEGLAAERFLILPHPEVLEYFQRKAADYDRWLRGMRRIQARLDAVADPVAADTDAADTDAGTP
jgi:NAD(P)-dependent dehydrogenase (short-subunit alcohol dehydrogenase family)